MKRPTLKVRRPPEPAIAGARYARWYRALVEAWSAYVLAHPEASRAELEHAWANLTDRKVWGRFFAQLAAVNEQAAKAYFSRMFGGRAQPRSGRTPSISEGWVSEQFKILAWLGGDQIDRLMSARGTHTGRTDAKPAGVTRKVNQARKANVALIGGTDLRQHTQLIDLFKTAQGAGSRHETLVDEVQSILGGARARAKLVARDQTVKHNAAVNQAQAEASGIVEYTWRITRDLSCRPMHKALEGTVHRYDRPPITNKEGDRNNPSEDYQCRCTAVPLPSQTQDLFAGLGEPDFGPGLGF